MPLNLTRFLVLGTGSAPQTGADKTSLFFSTPHNPGALRAALGPFAEQGINLNRIESRPSKQAPWGSFCRHRRSRLRNPREEGNRCA